MNQERAHAPTEGGEVDPAVLLFEQVGRYFDRIVEIAIQSRRNPEGWRLCRSRVVVTTAPRADTIEGICVQICSVATRDAFENRKGAIYRARMQVEGPDGVVLRYVMVPALYYRASVPDGEDPRVWAPRASGDHGFGYEIRDAFPLAQAAVADGDVLLWPLDEGVIQQLREDGVAVGLTTITSLDLYAQSDREVTE